jgi:hypothetical protein
MTATEWAEHTDRAARVVEASAGVIDEITPAFNVLADIFRAFGGTLAALPADVLAGMDRAQPAGRRRTSLRR